MVITVSSRGLFDIIMDMIAIACYTLLVFKISIKIMIITIIIIKYNNNDSC